MRSEYDSELFDIAQFVDSHYVADRHCGRGCDGDVSEHGVDALEAEAGSSPKPITEVISQDYIGSPFPKSSRSSTRPAITDLTARMERYM